MGAEKEDRAKERGTAWNQLDIEVSLAPPFPDGNLKHINPKEIVC